MRLLPALAALLLPALALAQMTPEVQAQLQKGCALQANAMADSYCRQVKGAAPETLAALRTAAKANREALLRSCPEASIKAELAKLDGCLAGLDAQVKTETADAEKRRAADGDKVAKLKADPRYLPTRDRARTAHDGMRMACESADLARKDGSPNVDAWDRQCAAAKEQSQKADQAMRELVGAFGIDLRDSQPLW